MANNYKFKDKTFIITGSSRGIGKAIGLKLASQGANIVVAAKSIQEDPRLGGTIFTAAQEMEEAGGQALAVQCDVRFEEQIENVITKTLEKFGNIDGLVNNASAISLANTPNTETKRYNLMFDINVRGTFLMTKHCYPHLIKAKNPHILTLSPPLNITPKWLKSHVAYSISKFNMSMLTLGWAEEFKKDGIAANSLWPVTTIATKSVENILSKGGAMAQRSRTPDIVADAAVFILGQPAKVVTGHLFLDETVLSKAGVKNFKKYAISAGGLQKDLFI